MDLHLNDVSVFTVETSNRHKVNVPETECSESITHARREPQSPVTPESATLLTAKVFFEYFRDVAPLYQKESVELSCIA